MKKFILFALPCLLAACGGEKSGTPAGNDQDGNFDVYKQAFVLQLWKMHPGWASSVGYHAYDSVLTIPDQQRRKQELDFCAAHLDSLNTFSFEKLSDFNKTDFHLIRDHLNASVWSLNTLRSQEWDPSSYNVCGAFAEMLNNNYDSIDTRLHNFGIKLRAVPAFYAAAKNNIKNPTKEHTDLAIQQNRGGVSVFNEELKSALDRCHLGAAEKDSIRNRALQAAKAVEDYAKWLEQVKDAGRSFRLGKDLYVQKFSFDLQSGYTADQIYQKALERKKFLHGKMFDITTQIWAQHMKSVKMPGDSLAAIKMLIDKLSARHVRPDSFQIAIEKQIPELVEFIKKKDLIYLDPSKPLVVRKEPAYMAGFAGASINSPGPYDLNGNTYYNVGSVSAWPKEKAESYLREYNHYILQILNIHEAIPGHYTQLIYSNASAAAKAKDSKGAQMPGIIKSILGNGAMVEGWAVYTELMMLENGYGAAAGSNEPEPEMWLMYYKWNLRSTCNTILDYRIHVENLQKEEALNLLTQQAFQQQAEAEGKWRRATLSQVQLCSYFTGFTEIVALREELKQKQGEKFRLKEFHEKFLSYGSAPVKYIRQMMLADL